MTPPTGYVEAVRVNGVVKVPDRTTSSGVFLPGRVVGPGDTAVIPDDEALSSDDWRAPDSLISARQAEVNVAVTSLDDASDIDPSAPTKKNGGS